jgi:hypothetical protein
MQQPDHGPRYILPEPVTEPIHQVTPNEQQPVTRRHIMSESLRRKLVTVTAVGGLVLGAAGLVAGFSKGHDNESPTIAPSHGSGEVTTLVTEAYLNSDDLVALTTMTAEDFSRTHPKDAAALASVGKQVLEATETAKQNGTETPYILVLGEESLTRDPNNPLIEDVAKKTAQIGNLASGGTHNGEMVPFAGGYDPEDTVPEGTVLAVTGAIGGNQA